MLTGIIIAFNEEPFIETSIRHAFKFCDRIIVVEGAVLKSRDFTKDGRSTDKTIDILVRLKDEFRGKLHLVFREGFWESKAQMFAATNGYMEDGWVVEIDCDEFMRVESVKALMSFLKERTDYTQVNLWLYHFFGGFDRMVKRKAEEWGNQFSEGIPRFFRSNKESRWESHTPPILSCGKPQKIMSRDQTMDDFGLIIFHYGYVWLSQVVTKSRFHAPWQHWHTAAEWRIVRLSKDPTDLGNFEAHNQYELFKGEHPIDVTKLKEGKVVNVDNDPYLVFIGTGRCGTGYAAACMQANGVDVQHETMGKDGVASWDLAFPKLINHPWTGTLQVPTNSQYIHLVRNPLDCIASLRTIGEKSWKFMCNASHNSMKYGVTLRAMMHYILWNTQCASLTTKRVRIEYFHEDMSSNFRKTIKPLDKPVNQREHSELTLSDLHKVSSELTKIITQMAKAYGYE